MKFPVAGSLPLSNRELNLRNTLCSRQVFGWKELPDGETWRGVLGNRVVDLNQSHHLSYRVRAGTDAIPVEAALSQFFRCDVSLWDVYQLWSRQSKISPLPENNAGFGLIQAIRKYPGVRLLRPPFFQALITQLLLISDELEAPRLLAVLSKAFGTYLGKVDGEEYFAFPTVAQLTPVKEALFATLGPLALDKRLHRAIGWIVDRGGEPWLAWLSSQEEVSHSVVVMELKQLLAHIDILETDIMTHRLFMAFSDHSELGTTFC